MYKDDEEDEAPTVVLTDQNLDANNPFKKLCDKEAEKFKYIIPADKADPNSKQEKKGCGNGKVSIQRGEIGPEGCKML